MPLCAAAADPLVVVLPDAVHGVVVRSRQHDCCSDHSRDEDGVASKEVSIEHVRGTAQHSGRSLGRSSQAAIERRLRLSRHTATRHTQQP